jgi:uncharacterized membrane protein YcaP (DUF421 family)
MKKGENKPAKYLNINKKRGEHELPFWESQASLTVLQWIIRTTVIYLWLHLVTKLMGQREVGSLTVSDFIIAITIGSVAAAPLASSTDDLIGPVSSIGTLGALNILIAYLALKNSKFRRIVQEEPIVLVQNGQILEDTMRSTRYNLDDLLTEIRIKNIPDLADVEFAILEANGSLSVIPKSQSRPLTPQDLQIPTQYEGMPTVLIEDGNIVEDNLRENQLSKTWLLEQLENFGIKNEKEVFAAILDTRGRFYVSKKNQTNE